MAIAILLVVLIFVFWQPRGLNVGWPASVGAALMIVTGNVGLNELSSIWQMVWNATLTVIATVMISRILEEIGFFEWAALHLAAYSNGSGFKLYGVVVLICAMVSAIFNNDGTALMVTPIVLSMLRAVGMNERSVLAFIMVSGFVADTGSVPLVISNLVNIIGADALGIGFLEYARNMILPGIVAVLSSYFVAGFVYRKELNIRFAVERLMKPENVIKDRALLKGSIWLIGCFLVAYFLGGWFRLPVSCIAWTTALIFFWMARKSPAVHPALIWRGAPWGIIVFALGMFVIIFGVGHSVTAEYLKIINLWSVERGLFAAIVGTGFVSAILSSVINNLPAVMLQTIDIREHFDQHAWQQLIQYANIIGCDIGPKMTPVGSLATLIWLHFLQGKGVKISWLNYIKYGVILTLPVLFITLCSLYFFA